MRESLFLCSGSFLSLFFSFCLCSSPLTLFTLCAVLPSPLLSVPACGRTTSRWFALFESLHPSGSCQIDTRRQFCACTCEFVPVRKESASRRLFVFRLGESRFFFSRLLRGGGLERTSEGVEENRNSLSGKKTCVRSELGPIPLHYCISQRRTVTEAKNTSR